MAASAEVSDLTTGAGLVVLWELQILLGEDREIVVQLVSPSIGLEPSEATHQHRVSARLTLTPRQLNSLARFA